MGKRNFFWQSERSAVHVRFRRDVSDIMKADNVCLAKFWPLHRLSDPLHKKLESVLLFFFIGEAIDVNERQLNFFLVRRLPDERISFIEKTNKYVQKLDSVHRQIHKAVIKFKHLLWNSLLLWVS